MVPKRMLALLAILAVAILAACGGDDGPPTIRVERRRVVDSILEPARTRLEHRHLVSMPVAARIAHVELKPGDPVAKGQPLVVVDRVPFETAAAEASARVAELEARLALALDEKVETERLAQARAMAEGAAARRESAAIAIEEWRPRAERLRKELDRVSALAPDSYASQSQLDEARMNWESADAAWRGASSNLKELEAMAVGAEREAAAAEALLARRKLEAGILREQLVQAVALRDAANHRLALTNIVSPIDGIVLERYELGGGALPDGARLFLLGNLDELEVEADLLTQDAFLVQPGDPVEYTVAAGEPPLKGVVSRVEPAGFVKLSSLGVEQQRVYVISTVENRPANLGWAYRLQARYVRGAKDDALAVPRSAVLQAPDETLYVFRLDGGRIRRTPVTLGLKSDFWVEIADGLDEGATVLTNPDATMEDGQRM